MKKSYLQPSVSIQNVKVEKGFATTGGDSMTIQSFSNADKTDANSGW